jgi:hypothetical protein
MSAALSLYDDALAGLVARLEGHDAEANPDAVVGARDG